MDPSQVLGDPEKWSSSSESGWTMYIGSQIHHGGDDDHGDDDDDNNDDDVYFITDKEKHDKRNDNHESDDSMASDASSGPTLQEFPCENKEGLLRNHAFRVDQNKYSSGKKACKQVQKSKRDKRRIKSEKQQSVRKADSAASQV